MTQAFNLSQLANKVNTSGQLDAASGLSGIAPVANGGTGASTLTANYVLLGNGTSAVQMIAPSTSGNALVSNGTTWQSGTINAVTSIIAGSGIGVSGATGSVTISQDVYTGTNVNNTTYPVGSYVIIQSNSSNRNASAIPYVPTSPPYDATLFYNGPSGIGAPACSGTWRARGVLNGTCGIYYSLSQRVA
jgi:hypothetical protein